MILHAQWMEWVFLAASSLTFSLSIFTLRDAQTDLAFLLGSGKDGLRRLIADMNVRGELFRMMISLFMLLAAFASIFMEPPPPAYYAVPQSLLFLVAWIMVALLVSTWSLTDRGTRRKIARYTDAANPTDPMTGAVQDPSKPADESPPTKDRRKL